MTLIASTAVFTSKAALKAALDAGIAQLHEPSIMGEWMKLSRDLPAGFRDVVTNGSKRTKFAEIEKRADGTWKVT